MSHNEYENIYIPFTCEYFTDPSDGLYPRLHDGNNVNPRPYHENNEHDGKANLYDENNATPHLQYENNLTPSLHHNNAQQNHHRSTRSINAGVNVAIDHFQTYQVEMQSTLLAKYKALLTPRFCYASPIEKSQQWMKYFFIRRG